MSSNIRQEDHAYRGQPGHWVSSGQAMFFYPRLEGICLPFKEIPGFDARIDGSLPADPSFSARCMVVALSLCSVSLWLWLFRTAPFQVQQLRIAVSL